MFNNDKHKEVLGIHWNVEEIDFSKDIETFKNMTEQEQKIISSSVKITLGVLGQPEPLNIQELLKNIKK